MVLFSKAARMITKELLVGLLTDSLLSVLFAVKVFYVFAWEL